MIKLKDILLEGKPSSIFVPRRTEDRVERMIKNYIRNGNKGDLDLSDLKLTVLPDILKDIDVGGIFVCNDNPGNFTEAQVRAVCDVKGEVI